MLLRLKGRGLLFLVTVFFSRGPLLFLFVPKGPEYRLHAMVFLSRSLAIMTLYYYEEIHQIQEPIYLGNLAIVFLALAGASLASWSVGENRSGSITDPGFGVHPAVQFFFSFLQMAGIAGCLFGLRRYSIMFYFCFVLQLNPFIMTLIRKNLCSKKVGVTFYGAMLVGGLIVGELELQRYPGVTYNHRVCQDLIMHSATLLRLGPRLPVLKYIQNNKFVMWLLLGLLLQKIRPHFDQAGEGGLSDEVIFIHRLLVVSTLTLWTWKGFVRGRIGVNVEKKKEV